MGKRPICADTMRHSIPPCKGCEKRYPACHDKCDEYNLWRKNDFLERRNKASFLNKNDHSYNIITNKNIKVACESEPKFKYAVYRARYNGSTMKQYKA